MKLIIVARDTQGGPGERRTGHTAASPHFCASGGARTVFPNARCIRDWVHREGWMVRIRVGRGRAHHPRTLIFSKPSEAGRIFGWHGRSVITPPALNFTRPHGAGNRIAARFEPTKQPRSCFANAFQLLRVWVLDHVEKPSRRSVPSGVEEGQTHVSV